MNQPSIIVNGKRLYLRITPMSSPLDSNVNLAVFDGPRPVDERGPMPRQVCVVAVNIPPDIARLFVAAPLLMEAVSGACTESDKPGADLSYIDWEAMEHALAVARGGAV